MPIYEYQCKACGATSEFLFPTGKSGGFFCRKCGSENMERILSIPSYISRVSAHPAGKTCCGREERCETPPCSEGKGCSRD